eukprot:6350148-Amphidinium_carterae.1
MTAVARDAFGSSSPAAVSEARAVDTQQIAQVVASRVDSGLDKILEVLEQLVAQLPHTTGTEPDSESKAISAAVVEALKEKERGESVVVSNATGISHKVALGSL